jgi:hypothetical protein
LLRCGEIPKEFAFETCVKYAIFTLVRLDRRAVATVSTKHPGKEILESISRTIRVWLKRPGKASIESN